MAAKYMVACIIIQEAVQLLIVYQSTIYGPHHTTCVSQYSTQSTPELSSPVERVRVQHFCTYPSPVYNEQIYHSPLHCYMLSNFICCIPRPPPSLILWLVLIILGHRRASLETVKTKTSAA